MLCDTPEGWDGLGGGREVQEGRDMYLSMADSYGRNQHNIVKQLSSTSVCSHNALSLSQASGVTIHTVL